MKILSFKTWFNKTIKIIYKIFLEINENYLWVGSFSSAGDNGGNPIDSNESIPNGTNNGFVWSTCACFLN